MSEILLGAPHLRALLSISGIVNDLLSPELKSPSTRNKWSPPSSPEEPLAWRLTNAGFQYPGTSSRASLSDLSLENSRGFDDRDVSDRRAMGKVFF